MSEIKLVSLKLINFKGIRDFVFNPNGGNVSIYGDNATGKTTLYDAFLWVLFDKDSANRKDFEIKTLDAKGKALHNLDHEVEATLQIDDRQIVLRKVYAEKWAKKRGQAKQEFTGHTTEAFVNGVPVQKKEYEDRVNSIAKENVFKLLTNPGYFNEQLHWKDRRNLLLEVCGDISDQDVIASDKALSRLPEILGSYDMEEYKKIITGKRTKINDELKQIPVRIDEATRSLPDLTGIIPAALPDDIAKLQKAIAIKNDEISRIENGAESIEKTKALRIIEVEMFDILKKDREGIEEQIQAKQREITENKGKIGKLDTDIQNDEYSIEQHKKQVANLEQRMDVGRQEWKRINAEQFTFEQGTTCPTCGQPLPQERLDEAREKALADFNLNKAQRLEENMAKGKALKAEVEQLTDKITAFARNIEVAKDLWEQTKGLVIMLEVLEAEFESLRSQSLQHTGGDAYTAKEAKKAHIEREIAELKEGNTEAIAAVRTEIQGLRQDLAALEDTQAKVRTSETGHKRIAELETQEKELAAEYERLEGELYLCDQFTWAKVSMLDERINSRFKLAHFKMFEEQINGGLADCCETTYGGVSYPDLNHGAKLNIGLDIISTLIEFYGFSAPIFVDNAEAVTRLIEIPAQMIKLVVSEPDKALRVETENILREAV